MQRSTHPSTFCSYMYLVLHVVLFVSWTLLSFEDSSFPFRVVFLSLFFPVPIFADRYTLISLITSVIDWIVTQLDTSLIDLFIDWLAAMRSQLINRKSKHNEQLCRCRMLTGYATVRPSSCRASHTRSPHKPRSQKIFVVFVTLLKWSGLAL